MKVQIFKNNFRHILYGEKIRQFKAIKGNFWRTIAFLDALRHS